MIKPGQVFNRLTAVRFISGGKHPKWEWQCSCGRATIVAVDKAKSGHTKSCGCLWTETCRKHGHGHNADGQKSATYKAWGSMRSRVSGKYPHYQNSYTDRGIKVCDRWSDFKNFLDDMGECPPGMTLDRINNDGDYEPGNCRWATRFEQMANTRRTHLVTVNGQEISLKAACRALGLNYSTVAWRVIYGGVAAQEALY